MSRIYTPTERWYWDEVSQSWLPSPHKRVNELQTAVLQEFKPDRDGISNWVQLDYLKLKYPKKANHFGGKGANGSGFFTRELGLDFKFEKDHKTTPTARRCIGFNWNKQVNRSIKSEIWKAVVKLPCVVLGTNTDVQCDHKNGRYTDANLSIDRQRIDQFQPLHASANGAKREHCDRCKKDNKRFDARLLGYPKGWLYGDAQYEGTCQGCFWYDPVAFRASLKA